jgi:choice-of-anchor C domain-containing protein
MPRLRRILTAGLTAAMVVTAPPAAATTGPVFHDGFESPAVSGQFQRYPAGTRLGRWTVTRGDVDLATTRLWQVSEGRQNLDLDGAANGAVTTTFPVKALTTYRISYALAGNPAAAPLLKTGEVLVNGRTAQRFSFDTGQTSLSRMDFGRRALYVFSLTGQMSLEFASTTAPAGWGPVLDDVRVDSCLVVLCPSRTAATRE